MRLLTKKEKENPKYLNEGLPITFLNSFIDEVYNYIARICDTKNYTHDIFGVAMTLFHYYTYYKSVREIDRAEIAVACVFLACKFEYTFLKVEEATEFYKKLKISKGLGQSCGHNPDFTKFEVDILTFVGYEMDIETPHKNFFYYLERNFQILLKDQKVLNFGIKLINDSYRSNMCIFFSSKYIALASLFISLNILEITGFDKFEINEILLWDKTINKSIFLSCMDNLFKVFEMSIVNKE